MYNYIDQLPHWAKARSNGEYMIEGSQLCTRDGRKCDNAVVVRVGFNKKIGEQVAECITDKGSTFILTKLELEKLFYKPALLIRTEG